MPAVQDRVTTGSQTEPEARPRGATRVRALHYRAHPLFFAVWMTFATVGPPRRDELGLTDSRFADLSNGTFFVLLLLAGTTSAWLHLAVVRILRKGFPHLARETEHREQFAEAR